MRNWQEASATVDGSHQPDQHRRLMQLLAQGRSTPMALRTPTLIALSAVTLLSGCSAFRNYDSELAQTNQQLATGNVDAALTLLEKNNTSPDKDLLYYFEKGELLRAKGDLSGSQNAWTSADKVVGQWEDSV